MMPLTRSGGRYRCSSRSVPSKVPMSAPDADIRDTNSSSRSSTTSASTVPSDGHHDRQFAHFVVVEQRPDLAAILFAQRQHQNAARLGPLNVGPFGRLL